MFKKILAAVTVAAALLLVAPGAAIAQSPRIAQYTGGSTCQFAVGVVQSGDTATLICVPGTWASGEIVDWTATGESGASIQMASFRAASSSMTFAKNANADGSDVLTVQLPADAVGQYSIVGHGRQSDHTCPASLTVLPADSPGNSSGSGGSGSGLPDTGSVIQAWAIGLGGGLLTLGLLTVALAAWIRKVRSS